MNQVLNKQEFTNGILAGNLRYLSRAITLAESIKEEHQAFAQELIKECLPHSGNSWRIAVTGVPGVGKSTFLNSFGLDLIEKGDKVAVLAVDPSSEITGGSILGDKTRMEELAKSENAFIRPSPTTGSLGGITTRTYEAIILCEAAGFNRIFVETVGVGQSETLVKDITDCFLYLKVAGTGDDLQGIKKGIMEMADIIFINKADEQEKEKIRIHKTELNQSLKYLQSKESEWKPKILVGSGLNKNGFEELFNAIQSYFNVIQLNQYLNQNRKQQTQKRVQVYLEEMIQQSIQKQKINLTKEFQTQNPYDLAKEIFEKNWKHSDKF